MNVVRHIARIPVLGLCAGLSAAAPASASATEICDALRARFAEASPAATAASPLAADPARGPLQGELADLDARARALGCSSGSVIVIGGPHESDCREIRGLVTDIETRLSAAQSDNDRSAQFREDAEARAAIARQLRMNGCADATAPIAGVSQFTHPENGTDNLPPEAEAAPDGLTDGGSGATPSITAIHEQPKGHIPDVSAALSNGGSAPDRLPPALHGKARPMTQAERTVRQVGPRFFPDPPRTPRSDPAR